MAGDRIVVANSTRDIFTYKYNENSIIAEVYTEKHGKISGIIFGGTSIRIMKYNELTQKQKTLVDLIAQDQAHELFNK